MKNLEKIKSHSEWKLKIKLMNEQMKQLQDCHERAEMRRKISQEYKNKKIIKYYKLDTLDIDVLNTLIKNDFNINDCYDKLRKDNLEFNNLLMILINEVVLKCQLFTSPRYFETIFESLKEFYERYPDFKNRSSSEQLFLRKLTQSQ